MVLRYPEYFKSVLAVTFTNKATQEMKSRIVETLRDLGKGEHSMSVDLCEDLGLDGVQLKHRAQTVLNTILHNYSFFAVTTIDAFFQKVVRSFAKEIGIHTGFKIELDQNKVLGEVIDRLILKLSEDPQLLRWLTDFAISQINEGKSWDTYKSILSLSKELFKEQVVRHKEEMFAKLEDAEFMNQALDQVRSSVRDFERRYQKLGRDAVDFCEGNGLNESSFVYGEKGVAGYFYKVKEGEMKEPGARVTNALEKEAWVTKKSPDRDMVMQVVGSGLQGIVAEMVEYYEENIDRYQSLVQISRQLYAFGLLSKISQEIAYYKEDNELLLISDFQLFLNEIIQDSDSPYVYEKIGTRYKHFLIDEFQDTSSMQWGNFKPLVLDSLASGHFNMVVGDVKQSIYRWRGGDWDILLTKVKEGIDPTVVEERNLATNRRSKQNVVAFNNDFFERAPQMMEGELEAPESAALRIQEAYEGSSQEYFDTSEEGLVQLRFYEKSEDGEEHPLTQLIEDVQALQRANYGLSDIAILVRKNDEGRKVAEALMKYQMDHPDDGFGYDVLSNESLFIKNNKAVHLILQLLYYLMEPKERLYQKQVQYALQSCYAMEEWESQWNTVKDHRSKWLTLRLSELINDIVREFDLMAKGEDLPYVMAFQDAVEDFLMYESDTLVDFLTWWLENERRSIQVSGDQDAMTIMTIHQSKGLQFKAVLIPYCQWTLEHKSGGFTTQFLWSGRAASSGLVDLPLVPIVYTSGLKNTVFAPDYWTERHDIHLDNLNMLYVAMTRAEEVLIITSTTDGYGSGRLKTSGHLMYRYALTQGLVEEGGRTVEIGVLPAIRNYHEDLMRTFEITPRRMFNAFGDNISLRHQSRILEEAQLESINYGDIVHWIYSKIAQRSDFGSAIEMATIKFGLSGEELEQIKSHLRQIWELPGVSRWFTEDWEVKNEASILLSDGKMKRPDRVVIKDQRALVIDYKTGTKSAGHIRQVEEYKAILTKMGYQQVEGYLIYFSEPEVVAV
ncbi:hypothetical protein BFP72_05200 [Reichenbachiella sp. 5M10]|nr:hypothetical protein BFP72_05200 [Reichenbachiella sp. 5M10]